jgi:hypothetical protein
MNSVTEYTFRTKTGTCIVSPGKLELIRQGAVGKAANFMYGKSIRRGLFIYGVLGIIALIFGIWQLIDKSYIGGVLLCVIGAYFFWNVIASWNNSALNQIERSTVQSIDINPPNPPFTRGYFVIHFEYQGKMRKRLVMLPGTVSGGSEEYPKALSAMKETGWL